METIYEVGGRHAVGIAAYTAARSAEVEHLRYRDLRKSSEGYHYIRIYEDSATRGEHREVPISRWLVESIRADNDPDEFAVTFDPDCTDDFPSIRYLMSGDPLFDVLCQTILQSSGYTSSLERELIGNTEESACVPVSEEPSVVCGWFRDESNEYVRLEESGDTVDTDYQREDLSEWCADYRANRTTTKREQ